MDDWILLRKAMSIVKDEESKMHRINNAYAKLWDYLFSQNKFVTLDEIAKEIGASKSTVWRHLAFLEYTLSDVWIIEKDELKGVFLHKPQGGTLEDLWGELRKYNTHFQILRLIFLNNGATQSQISEKLHISYTSVHRKINQIRQVAERAGIELSSKPYELVGDEKKVRSFYMRFWELTDNDTRSTINSTYFIEKIKFQEDLKQLLSEHSIGLHTGAFRRLITVLKISNIRIIQGNYVAFPSKVIDSLKETKYFKIADKLFQCQYIEPCSNRENKMQEILFVALHLMKEEVSLDRSKELYFFKSRLKRGEEELLSSLIKHFSE